MERSDHFWHIFGWWGGGGGGGGDTLHWLEITCFVFDLCWQVVGTAHKSKQQPIETTQ